MCSFNVHLYNSQICSKINMVVLPMPLIQGTDKQIDLMAES